MKEEIEDRFRYYQTRCNICGTKRPSRSYAYFFSYEGQELQCCTKCKAYAPGDITREEYWDRQYNEPDTEAALWRYVDLTKFIDLVLFKRIWLSQVAALDDVFEGALGAKTRQDDWRHWMRSYLLNAVKHPPVGSAEQTSDEDAQREADRLLEDTETSLSRQKIDTYVNCWHVAGHESFLMWKVYARDRPDSVCVKTSFGRIRRCLGGEYHVGVVDYIDFRNKFPDVNWPFLYKRAAFVQESEARVFVRRNGFGTKGFHVNVDPSVLIEEVLISPEAPKWIIENIELVIGLSGVPVVCRVSDLSEEPF